jgi:hypothetical protein
MDGLGNLINTYSYRVPMGVGWGCNRSTLFVCLIAAIFHIFASVQDVETAGRHIATGASFDSQTFG